jgi:hypothetical protein
MSDVRNGTLAIIIPFSLLLLFWELKVRKNHWYHHASEGFFNVKKIASVLIPLVLVLLPVIGIPLTYKYAKERRDLRDLASKDMTHFAAISVANPAVPVVLSKETAQKAADAIKYSKLSDTITAVKEKKFDTDYNKFWEELQKAYGVSTGLVLPSNFLPGLP